MKVTSEDTLQSHVVSNEDEPQPRHTPSMVRELRPAEARVADTASLRPFVTSGDVPIRTARAPNGRDIVSVMRAALVAMHVDGTSSVADIARTTDLDEDEVAGIVALLVCAGVLELGDTHGASESPDMAPDTVPSDAAPETTMVDDQAVERAQASMLAAMPIVVMAEGDLHRLPLDPLAAFLLSQIDGSTSVAALLDRSCVSSGPAFTAIQELVGFGAIAFFHAFERVDEDDDRPTLTPP